MGELRARHRPSRSSQTSPHLTAMANRSNRSNRRWPKGGPRVAQNFVQNIPKLFSSNECPALGAVRILVRVILEGKCLHFKNWFVDNISGSIHNSAEHCQKPGGKSAIITIKIIKPGNMVPFNNRPTTVFDMAQLPQHVPGSKKCCRTFSLKTTGWDG